MEILKLVGVVLSVLSGVTIIIKLYVSGLRELINAEKEQRTKENEDIKKDIEKLFETRVSKEVCQERCKK